MCNHCHHTILSYCRTCQWLCIRNQCLCLTEHRAPRRTFSITIRQQHLQFIVAYNVHIHTWYVRIRNMYTKTDLVFRELLFSARSFSFPLFIYANENVSISYHQTYNILKFSEKKKIISRLTLPNIVHISVMHRAMGHGFSFPFFLLAWMLPVLCVVIVTLTTLCKSFFLWHTFIGTRWPE